MKVPVQVLASRSYSFAGDKGETVNMVEIQAMVKLGEDTVIGKVNNRGTLALRPGVYEADLRAAERAGKLSFSLSNFVPAAASYQAAAGK